MTGSSMAAAPPAGDTPTTGGTPAPPTEGSLMGRFVALLTPVFTVLAGAGAGWVAENIPGVALDPAQITAFMVAAAGSALTAAWKWLQGWQQHERMVAFGSAAARRAAPPTRKRRRLRIRREPETPATS